MPLAQIRRRELLLGTSSLAALTSAGCPHPPESPSSSTEPAPPLSTDTGDSTASGSTTTDASTTDVLTSTSDPSTSDTTAKTTTDTTTDTTTAGSTTAGSTGGVVCTPMGADTGLVVAGFDVGACMPAINIASTLVLRDDLGFYAMTNTCTHVGCAVACPQGGVMICPCHGSKYNANGDVIGGPALDDLAHYLVSFECVGGDLKIYVDSSQVLKDRQTRIQPP